MRKSPFSTPRGNGGRQGLGWSSGGSPGRGYGRPRNYEFYSPNRSQTSQSPGGDEDFIPFDNTPPSNQRKSSDNWQSARGQWHGSGSGRGARRQSASPGYTNYRDNRGRDNHQQPPYFKDGGRQFYGPRKSFQRGNTRRRSDISQYMNLRSFLEDPWSELSTQSSNNSSIEESRNDSFLDLSCSNTVLGEVHLDNSVDERNVTNTDPRTQEAANDSLIESDNSSIETIRESVDLGVCSDNSRDKWVN